jgi:hypothetical protein
LACGLLALLAGGAIAFAIVISEAPDNDLGVSRADLAMGGLPDVEALRANTKVVADAYLAQREPELKGLCGGPYELTVDYTLSSKLRSLGYRSSFYYYCWNIYLPYSMASQSGSTYTVVVQLSDATARHTHSINKFRVIRVMVIDQNDQITKTFEG